MATEVVVKQNLSEEMISAGAELTRRLDGARFIVSASLWLYVPETNAWRLVIGSPEVRTRGPKWAYKKVQSVLSKSKEQAKIALKDVTVLDSKDPLISLLKVAIKTGNGISGITFTQNVINGTTIEDAYIYRVT
jgi:hypothetical protein